MLFISPDVQQSPLPLTSESELECATYLGYIEFEHGRVMNELEVCNYSASKNYF